MRRTVTSGAWWMSPRAATIASLLPAVLAIFIGVHQLTLHGVLHGVVLPNEAQGIGSAIALTRGALPYSNFPLAQPPGMTIAMLPFAWLTHFVSAAVAIVALRLVTLAVTVVAVFLVGYAARPYGIPASLLAGMFTATYTLGFFSTAGATVGPYILLFTFIGIGLAFRDGEVVDGPRMLFAGIFLGFACTMKPWAVIPAVVVAGCAAAAWQDKRERLLPAISGILIGIVVPCLIFFLAAPGEFWRDVVVSELPGHGSVAVGTKVAEVIGLAGAAAIHDPGRVAIGLAVIILIVVAIAGLGGAGSSSSYDWFLTITSIAVLLAVFLPGAMSVSYGEFAFPFIAIAVVMTLGRLVALVAATWSGQGTDPRSSIASALALLMAASAVAVASIVTPADGRYYARYADQHSVIASEALETTIPAGACALSDNPMLLIVAGRFAGNGSTCPVVVDLAADKSLVLADPGSEPVTAQWQSALADARFIVLSSSPQAIWLHGPLAHFVGQHYALAATRDGVDIYVSAVGSATG